MYICIYIYIYIYNAIGKEKVESYCLKCIYFYFLEYLYVYIYIFDQSVDRSCFPL